MDPLKNTDEKINKYCTLIFYIFLTILACIGAFYAIFAAYDWKIEKNDFTNWLIAGGTIASAFGLIWFSYLTYKNQKNNEFYSLFKVLLEENNKLLKEIMESKKDNLFNLNITIINLFRMSKNIFLEDGQKLEINFLKKSSEQIDLHYEFKPYLITLFRLLKLISTSNKISHNDKKEYYGLVRGLTPPDIQFLILFNSLSFREHKKRPNYTDLLIESRFFEHLPITESWLKMIYLSGKTLDSKHLVRDSFLTNQFIPLLKQYITSGELIDLQAFGQSIYLEQKQA